MAESETSPQATTRHAKGVRGDYLAGQRFGYSFHDFVAQITDMVNKLYHSISLSLLSRQNHVIDLIKLGGGSASRKLMMELHAFPTIMY